MHQVAAVFTYDNALALLAFLASGDTVQAELIADALVYAQVHGRFYTDGRLRNAYQAGDLILPPGWTPNGRADTGRMPGWYELADQRRLEDEFDVSTQAGNDAWAKLALRGYYESQGGAKYLAAAERLGEWVEANSYDSRGAAGYTAGFGG